MYRLKFPYYLFFFLLISPGATVLLTAQDFREKTDSLEIILADLSDDTEQKITVMNQLSSLYVNSDTEKSIHYAKEVLRQTNRTANKKAEAIAYKNIGDAYLKIENRDIALKNYTKALEIFGELKNFENEGIVLDVLQNAATIYSFFGDYNLALNYNLKALDGHTKNKNSHKISDLNNNIGSLYLNRKDYERALEYFKRSEQGKIKNGYIKDKAYADILSNIGVVYYKQQKYKEAEQYYMKALSIAEILQSHESIAVYLNNLGNVYAEEGKFSEAEKTLLKSLESAKKINGNKDFYFSSVYGDLGALYLQKYKKEKKGSLINESIDYLEKAVDLFLKIKDFNFYQEYSHYLSEAYTLKGDYKKALDAFREHSRYKDSLFNEEKTKEFTRRETRYEFMKREDSVQLVNEKEIAVRDATLEANQKQKWFLSGGILLLSAFGGLLFYQNRLRKKKNEELDEANRMKTGLLNILNHDFRIPIGKLVQYLQNTGKWDEDTQKQIKAQTLDSARNLLVAMEDTLLWSKGQMDNFKPQHHFLPVDELFEDIGRYFEHTERVSISFEDPEGIILQTDENYLKTIMRNLTSNAVKALEETENAQIIWHAGKENGKSVLSITDNGPGGTQEQFRALYDEQEAIGGKTGLGLHLVRDMAKAIGCTVIVDTAVGKGTVISLVFSK